MDINWTLILPIIAIQLLLQIIALVDLFKQEFTKEKKIIWTIVILFTNLLGPIVYFVFGRRDN